MYNIYYLLLILTPGIPLSNIASPGLRTLITLVRLLL